MVPVLQDPSSISGWEAKIPQAMQRGLQIQKDSGTSVLNIEFLEDMNLYLNEKKRVIIRNRAGSSKKELGQVIYW